MPFDDSHDIRACGHDLGQIDDKYVVDFIRADCGAGCLLWVLLLFRLFCLGELLSNSCISMEADAAVRMEVLRGVCHFRECFLAPPAWCQSRLLHDYRGMYTSANTEYVGVLAFLRNSDRYCGVLSADH